MTKDRDVHSSYFDPGASVTGQLRFWLYWVVIEASRLGETEYPVFLGDT